MAENEDFMNQAVNEYLGIDPNAEDKQDEQKQETQDTAKTDVGDEAKSVADSTASVQETNEQKTVDNQAQQEISSEKILEKFNELTGLNFDTIDRVKDFADKYQKYPEVEKQLSVMPELIDALEQVKNPLHFFKDETEFKINELTKDKKYEGKESLIRKILRNDLDKVDDLEVIKMASQLKAKEGVRNPLRAELKLMGIDPDEVVDSYDELDDDTKDLLKIKADQYREDLPKIGENVKVPKFEGTVVEQLLNEKKAMKEDFDARLNKITPVAQAIVSEIKEIPVTGDFNFKLELSPDQIKSYSQELAEVVLSEKHDLTTKEGKQQVYSALIDMFKTDFFDKIVEAAVSYKTSQAEENARRENNNEKPLNQGEPAPRTGEGEKDLITQAAEYLVNRD